ncbi:MAG: hypothetical protein ACHQ01_07410 [Candidatus Limnocylindrales bacterium]
MDHQKFPARQFDTCDLKGNAALVGPKEHDEIVASGIRHGLIQRAGQIHTT